MNTHGAATLLNKTEEQPVFLFTVSGNYNSDLIWSSDAALWCE